MKRELPAVSTGSNAVRISMAQCLRVTIWAPLLATRIFQHSGNPMNRIRSLRYLLLAAPARLAGSRRRRRRRDRPLGSGRARLQAAGPERQVARAEGLSRQVGRAVLLSEGPDAGLHDPGLRVPRQHLRLPRRRRADPRRQRRRRRIAQEILGEARPAVPDPRRLQQGDREEIRRAEDATSARWSWRSATRS